jgi:signal transduction histidine kinase
VKRRLVISMTALVAIVAMALAIPMAIVVSNDQRAAFVSELEVDTLATATQMSSVPFIDWQAIAEEAAARTGARVVAVSPARDLLADSGGSDLDRSFDRPEIVDALAGSFSSDVRESDTLGEELRYVAAPIIQGFQIVGAVRLSLPDSRVDQDIRGTQLWLAAFVVSVIVAAGLVAWLLARSISAPLRNLAAVAEELPEDLSRRASTDDGPAEVRAVASALNVTADRLGGILRRTQRVAADASHHLRTPLTGVRLRLEAIEDTTDQPEVAQEARAATAEVDRLTHRIEQVLELARGDAAAVPIVEQDVSAVVAERVDAASSLARERDLDLVADVAPGIVVSAPRGAVSRVVDELIGNALAYARSRIVVRLSITATSLELEVADDGPGIPEGERESVFDRFRRGTSAVPGGSGLGLALVRETAEAMGGRVTAEASADGGAAIRVVLPLTLRQV